MLQNIATFLQQISITHLNILLILGIAVFFGTIGGKIFQKLKIPQVVGYIIIGIILGQSGLKIFDKNLITTLQPFSYFALALIGFMIGGELKVQVFKKFGKQFTYILLFEAIMAFIVVGVSVSLFGFFFFHNLKLSITLGLLLGSIASATAPAATTDVLWENKTKGPLTTTVLGIVAMDDGVALLLFAVSTSVVGILMGQTTENLGISLLKLGYEVLTAVMSGLLFGWLLTWLLKKNVEPEKTLAFAIGLILLMIGLAIALHIDMLLAAMTLGFYIVNFSPKKSEEIFKLVQWVTPPIYVLFFVLVGANVNIWSISLLAAVIAVIYLLGRTSGKMLGAKWGAKLSQAPKTVEKFLPYCLFSQAGVAIGLSLLAGQRFPNEIGTLIIMIITTTTFIVQVIGPPFVKYAVAKAGEVGLNVTEDDLIRQSKASDVISPQIPVINEHMKIEELLQIISEHDNFYYPVVDNKKHLLGIISIEHIKNIFMASELTFFLLVHDLMIPAAVTCTSETPLLTVQEQLKQNNIDYLPVVAADKQVQGIIEQRNIQKLISEKILAMQEKLAIMENNR